MGEPLLPLLRIGTSAEQSHLVYGDNLAALDLAEALELVFDEVCIDPPYNTGTKTFVGARGEATYADSWPSDEDFLAWLRPRVARLAELMDERAPIYLHIDKKVGYLVRAHVLDAVFGRDAFRSEITRLKCNAKNFKRKAYGSVTDVLYLYGKSPATSPDPMTFNDHRLALSDEDVRRQFPKTDPNTGRRYNTQPIYGAGESAGATGKPWRGMLPPHGRHWAVAPAELDKLDAAGNIEWSASGNPRRKVWADESQGNKLADLWLGWKDKGYGRDRYPTEKPLAMVEHLVLNGSNSGGLVCDIFAGSGTTLVAAARNERRFFGADREATALVCCLARLADEAPDASYTVWGAALPAGLQVALTRTGPQLEVAITAADGSPARNAVSVVLAGRRASDGVIECRSLTADGTSWQGLTDADELVVVGDLHGHLAVAAL